MTPMFSTFLEGGTRPVCQVITRNSARCDECGDHLISEHRHDFKACTCGDLYVDGGKDYVRRGARGRFTDTSLSVIREMTNQEIEGFHQYGLIG